MKFPKMHIAQSVVNRLLNVADGIPSQPGAQMEPPELPDVSAQGDLIQAAVLQDPGALAAPQGIEDALVAKGLNL